MHKVQSHNHTLLLTRTNFVRSGGRKLQFIAFTLYSTGTTLGLGKGKASDITIALSKSYHNAKLSLITPFTYKNTIPYQLSHRTGKTIVTLIPSYTNTGIIAGNFIQKILRFTTIKNVICKIIGPKNKRNIITATFSTLKSINHDKTFTN